MQSGNDTTSQRLCYVMRNTIIKVLKLCHTGVASLLKPKYPKAHTNGSAFLGQGIGNYGSKTALKTTDRQAFKVLIEPSGHNTSNTPFSNNFYTQTAF